MSALARTLAIARSVARRSPLLRRLYHRLRPPPFDELADLRRMLPEYGVMVDVGAHHGESLEHFPGWTVIAVEPDPANRAQLLARHGQRSNVTIDPRAIAERDGETVTLYTSDVSTGIPTLTPFHPTHRPTTTVETVRLDTLLADVADVTLLKTDTEGWDLRVLRTFPWDRLQPQVIVCEFEDRKTVPLGYTYRDLADFLVERGYTVRVSEWYPVVEYGQQHRWRGWRDYPCELSDAAAWGNLVATRLA